MKLSNVLAMIVSGWKANAPQLGAEIDAVIAAIAPLNPPLAAGLKALAQSVSVVGVSATILGHYSLVLAVIVALLGRDHPKVAEHVGKLEAAGVEVPKLPPVVNPS